MEALPAGPQPAPQRQLIVGTALVCAAAAMLVGGMLAVWLVMRDRVIDTGESWIPSDASIPEVPSNIILISFGALLVFAQWAIAAAKHRQRANLALALGTTGVVAIAIVNAQAYIYATMELPIGGSVYGPMFYSVTGVFMALTVGGLVYTAVTAFRVLGGRDRDDEIVVAHAMYWYVMSAIYAAVWFFVYVTK